MEADGLSLRLTVISNNIGYNGLLKTSWGFSCLVEGTEKTILFDTLLLENMRLLHKDTGVVDVVVLSHIHADHTGGVEAFLRRNSHVDVFVPASFPISLRRAIASFGAHVRVVEDSIELFDRCYSSGEMGYGIIEQALILRSRKGLVIITGCAHPGIVDVVKEAREMFQDEVYLAMGGFHLSGTSDYKIGEIARALTISWMVVLAL
ncbi:MAG: MBL fold metallo-hydrolase [Deltaproteobacteria bacterium]|nr:MBL fold metallo-hydrolase [Deltaproteobacteria bacterium]